MGALFPSTCSGCGERDEGLCEACLERVVLIRAQGCFYCGRLADRGKTCPTCRRRSALSGVFIAAYYEPPLKEAIWQFKYDGRRALAGSLAPLLDEAARTGRAQALVPVPLARRREWWRGYNQARELARRLPGDRPVLEALRRRPGGRPQVELTRRERLENLGGAFMAVGPLPSRVLLIDDVATTGATLEAAARSLREAGVREVWAAVLARHK